MASTDFPLITNRACYFSLFREIKMGKRKAKKKRVQLQVKTTCIHGGLSDYTEYLIAQCTEFTIVNSIHSSLKLKQTKVIHY